jgi:alpha-ketoglutaric semialdehyde dehydrogenase
MINNNTSAAVNEVMQQALQEFAAFRQTDFQKRASFLDGIAANIEALGDTLIEKAAAETHLPAARLVGERGRTTGQLRMFAQMLREGSWVEAIIDTAIPDKTPPRPDLRRMLVPMGPVVVFGASNFPFAYSTAGGDTASALAAGCPVVVKAHPAHLETSSMVAGAIAKAIEECAMPQHSFQHVTDASFEAGKALVGHPATAAVGFTGSYAGGKALYDYAAARPKPIPVFAEMGSVNPVLLFPNALAMDAEKLAKQYAGSITLGMGQFCTNPGILIAVEGPGLVQFCDVLAAEMNAVTSAPMLHAGIQKAYYTKRAAALAEKGVELLTADGTAADNLLSLPTLARTSGQNFLDHPLLHEEVFGPYSLLITCSDMVEMEKVWRSLDGQLTTSFMATSQDLATYHYMVEEAAQTAGRVVFNGVPTGVEVCASMVHGGPFPACTDSRFSAVGTMAVKRWVRPVCYQNCPDEMLPAALQESNPLGILRMVNGEWKR